MEINTLNCATPCERVSLRNFLYLQLISKVRVPVLKGKGVVETTDTCKSLPHGEVRHSCAAEVFAI